MTPEKSRTELLTSISDSVKQLTEPRRHTELLDATMAEDTAPGRRRKAKRSRARRRHTVTLPPLLDALRAAMVPGAGADDTGGAGFESRPAAELEPLVVYREINSGAREWAKALGVKRDSLTGLLSGLVGADLTEDQMHHLEMVAGRWVSRARLATGEDQAPFTLGDKCPSCDRRGLTISGDLKSARCSRCATEWTPDTIGLLAGMLTANQTQETMPLVRCYWPHCHLVGPHEAHSDGRGRTWRDYCDVPDVAV